MAPPGEEVHKNLLVGLKTRAVNYILVWPVAIGLAWAYTAYANSWYLYLATAVLVILLIRVSIPNVAFIDTLDTKFYGGLDRTLKRNVPIAYVGVGAVAYAGAALWGQWPYPVIAAGVGFCCAFINGLQGQLD